MESSQSPNPKEDPDHPSSSSPHGESLKNLQYKCDISEATTTHFLPQKKALIKLFFFLSEEKNFIKHCL